MDSNPDEDWIGVDLQQGEEYTVRLRTKTSLPERLQATQLKILGIKDADGNAISGTASAGDAGKKVFVTNWEAPSTGRHYIAVGTEGTDRTGIYWIKHHEEGLELTTTRDSSVSATLDTTSAVAVMTALIRGMSSLNSREESRDTRTYLIFEVTLNREANKEVRVDYVTVDGTAVAGRDYEPKSGTLVFGRRDLTKTIWMPVEFDAAYEDTETMTLRLSNPRGGQIEDGTADRLHLRLLD